MKHMVHAAEFPGTLHGDDILGFCHHTDDILLSGRVITDGTYFPIGEILAAGTGMDRPFRFQNGVSKGLGIFQRKL